MKDLKNYRPMVRLKTGEVILLNIAVAPPAGWRMPLHSEKEYWHHGRIRDVHHDAPRVDDPWDSRLRG